MWGVWKKTREQSPFEGTGELRSESSVREDAEVSADTRSESSVAGVEEGIIAEKEILTPVQQLNEYIMISLRTMEGMDLGHITDRWGAEAAQNLAARAQRYIREGKMTALKTLALTQEGKLLADGIAADLFFDPADASI
jgi:coproporphyrinogen III oxidase-like Fe-S oxidoreductase